MFQNLNKEKNQILNQDGNIRVVSNPGTGKTLLLAHKYCKLVKDGVDPSSILCLTFTKKARNEMEERIRKVLHENQVLVHPSKLNIQTFHSFALDYLDENNLVSSNVLRYAIYKFIEDNEIFTYSEKYILETIVPRIENLLRYLKNFNIKPSDIDFSEVKKHIDSTDKYTLTEIENFTKWFIEIFKEYEKVKISKGKDYADFLIDFLNLKKLPKFDWILVDELQDVNKLEAEMVLKCSKNFFVVGDKKQAIFGFQGGSMYNFSLFSPSKEFVLKENFRSTNEILNYASSFFKNQTNDDVMRSEVDGLKNPASSSGEVPEIFKVLRGDDTFGIVANFIKEKFLDYSGKVGVLARTNRQVQNLSQRLKSLEVAHTTTYDSSSLDAKRQIINFLRGLLSKDVLTVKKSMTTPFFPAKIQDIFEASKDLKSLDELLKAFPKFKALRNDASDIEKTLKIFDKVIFPVCVSKGKDWVLAAQNIKGAIIDSLDVVSVSSLDEFSKFLISSDILSDDLISDEKITLTTVHKAKGRQWDCVVYLPTTTRNSISHADLSASSILKSKDIDPSEELREETLRIDFVALTRAKSKLYVFTNKLEAYLNDFAKEGKLKQKISEAPTVSTERLNEAYSLFVSGDFSGAKKLLSRNNFWLKEYLKAHFNSLNSLSFSTINKNAEEYLVQKVLGINPYSKSLELGNLAHLFAEKTLKRESGNFKALPEEIQTNIKKMIAQAKQKYPKIKGSEFNLKVPINEVFLDVNSNLLFTGKIDAVFSNGDKLLLIDWKSSKNTDYASQARQQLELYKHLYSCQTSKKLDDISVAIGFIALRERINDGRFYFEIDDKQPGSRVIDTLQKKTEKFLEWIESSDNFIESLKKIKIDNPIVKGVIEQYERES